MLCPASTFSPLLALQTQLGFVPAPAPGPEALSLASASEPANQILTGPIDPVSTPVLAALVPIAGSIRSDVDTGVSQVESGIGDIKADLPGIEAYFKGRKLLSASIQVADAHICIACFVLRTHAQHSVLQPFHAAAAIVQCCEDTSQQRKACDLMSAQNCLVASQLCSNTDAAVSLMHMCDPRRRHPPAVLLCCVPHERAVSQLG